VQGHEPGQHGADPDEDGNGAIEIAENFRTLDSFTGGRLDGHHAYQMLGRLIEPSHLPVMAAYGPLFFV
jgi:hypothetical protein